MQETKNLFPIGLIICGVLWLVTVFSASQKATDGPVADADLIDYAQTVLTSLQSQSFEQGREYCGVIYRDSDRRLQHTDPIKGESSTCTFEYTDDWTDMPRASFHTHGKFDPNYDSEIPSLDDLDGDISDKVLGFVSTPGGRFWMIDWNTEMAEMICGEGCLPQDPNYRSCPGDPEGDIYSLAELRSRASGEFADC